MTSAEPLVAILNPQAYGHHLLIKLPTKKTVTDSGLQLPQNMGQKFVYGRVLSLGQDVTRDIWFEGFDDHGIANKVTIEPGAIVIFDHLGARELLLDPVKDEGVVCIHDSMLFAVISEEELKQRNLPIP